MGKTDAKASRHLQQSMIIVPMGTQGVQVLRPLDVFGYLDQPSELTSHYSLRISPYHDLKVPCRFKQNFTRCFKQDFLQNTSESFRPSGLNGI